MDIEVGQADHVGWVRHTAIGRQGHVGDDEAALRILDPQIIGRLVDQGLQRQVLVLDWACGLEARDPGVNGPPPPVRRRSAADLSGLPARHRASGIEVGYVVVSGQPSAVGRRPLADLNGPPVGDPAGPGSRRSLRAGRARLREKGVDGGRGGPGGDAQGHDFRKGRARKHPLRRDAVDLAVAAIAQDEPLVGVEKANALWDIVDRRLVARHQRFEHCDPLLKVALVDFVEGRRSRARGFDLPLGRGGDLPIRVCGHACSAAITIGASPIFLVCAEELAQVSQHVLIVYEAIARPDCISRCRIATLCRAAPMIAPVRPVAGGLTRVA